MIHRVEEKASHQARRSAADYLPERHTLSELRRAAHDCQGCDLYKNATQVVFGEGTTRARLMVVGEVPGDKEDQEGKPFVGPAGRLLAGAFEAAGIQRTDIYLTNAVKHFKWKPQGTRRLHAKPSAREAAACRPWLEKEIEAVRPETIVCLGALASQALLGKEFRVTRQRGDVIRSAWAPAVVATWHPSAILRAPDPETREGMLEDLKADLKTAAATLHG